jgi:3-deoxy-manno-octulosonate cytidylyltransferase (CMP-KDO synthetase)
MIRVNSYGSLFDKGEVKIVLNKDKEALYFSRMAIPFIKGAEEKKWHLYHVYYRHVGMYAYRRDILEKICQLPVSALEKAESLEQLRWLENGFRIKCVETEYESHCIDSPEDVEKVLTLIKK